MYPLSSYLLPLGLEEDRFNNRRSKDEAIKALDQDTFLGHFHQTQSFSERPLEDAHNATWGNLVSCGSFLSRKMNCEGSLQEGLINLSSSTLSPMLNSRKRKAEMIEVQGAGRKDKHSKVCTARGPRDRRVRLSPKTAIQFYDVQDRLGYDRPSKAIDWLIKEAKTAIDALDEQLPPLGSENLPNSTNHGKFPIVSECGRIGKPEDLDDDAQVSGFGFFIDRAAPDMLQAYPDDNFNRSKALEETVLSPGYQQGFISGLATDLQTLDTNWEMARLQRILTVNENSHNGNSRAFCQTEALQTSIINYPPININFSGFSSSNELSNIAAAAIQKEGEKEKTDLTKTSSYLQYQGGISG